MTQADSVHSTPPLNSSKISRADPTRRHLLTVAAAGAVAAAIPTVALAGIHPDAELIGLGVRFERLVDRYYAAQRPWSRALVAAHAEHDLKFGDRKYEHSPEVNAAFEDSCLRLGVREADDALSAIFKEMAPLANTINAASVTSVEGLRAKALVAFWEVAPLGAGDTEFSFEDAYPFQQLFTAVAELCGLTDKIAATGYGLPDVAIVANSDDEEEEV